MADKICECCGRYPVTGASVDLVLENHYYMTACPHLDPEGRCRIYERRPPGCRNHFCGSFHPHFNIATVYEILDMFQEISGGDDG